MVLDVELVEFTEKVKEKIIYLGQIKISIVIFYKNNKEYSIKFNLQPNI